MVLVWFVHGLVKWVWWLCPAPVALVWLWCRHHCLGALGGTNMRAAWSAEEANQFSGSFGGWPVPGGLKDGQPLELYMPELYRSGTWAAPVSFASLHRPTSR